MGFAASQAKELFQQLRIGLQYLHGRHVSNIFDRYLSELERDVTDLMDRQSLNELLEPSDFGADVPLPNFEKSTPHRLRYVWDYFIFLYMSHKIHNIKLRERPVQLPIILYLRGSDYEFGVSKERAALGYATTFDWQFQSLLLSPLKRYFDVLKAISPTDLTWIMADMGAYLVARGNTLSNVAEFARARDEGIFLSSSSWKKVVVELFPAASLFLVYVSNQSQGLKFELESLMGSQLERNSVLILDKRRFDGRQSFFEVQESLRNGLYSSVFRDASAVDDPDDFERLLNAFPFRLEMPEDSVDKGPQDFMNDLGSLIQKALRQPSSAPSEIPFEFRVHLDAEARAKLDELRRYAADQIDKSVDQDQGTNWPAVLFFIELDVFLSLISGEVCRAAQSMARYAAIADFVVDFVRRPASDESIRSGNALEQYGNMAMNVAVDALMMGEWNDYGDRRTLARDLVRATEHQMRTALSRSVASARSVEIQPCRPKTGIGDEDTSRASVSLQKETLDAMVGKVRGPGWTFIDLHDVHRKE